MPNATHSQRKDAPAQSVKEDFPPEPHGFFQVYSRGANGWRGGPKAVTPAKARSEARRIARKGFACVVVERRVALVYSVGGEPAPAREVA